jgi:hypothetical protein
MFPTFQICWPLTGHVPRLRPGERFSRFRPRFHPVFTVPEVLGVERTRSVEPRHVSRFITFWPFGHIYPRFDRSVHRIASFLPIPTVTHVCPCTCSIMLSFHDLAVPDDRFPTTCPFWAVETNVFPQLGLLTKVYPRFGCPLSTAITTTLENCYH